MSKHSISERKKREEGFSELYDRVMEVDESDSEECYPEEVQSWVA